MKRSIAPLFIVTGLVILGCGGSGGIATIIEDYTYYVNQNLELVRRGELTGNTNTLFTSGAGNISHVRLSPSQTRLVFYDGLGITVQNNDGTGIVTIAGYKIADWNADGSRLYAVTTDNKIVTMNPDGSGISTVIFDGNFGAGITGMDVSQDGAKLVLCYAPSGWLQIHTLNVDGTGLMELTPTGLASNEPRWSQDGAKIFYNRRLSGQDNDIYVMNDDGTNQTPIANSSRDEYTPAPRTDGTVLYSYAPVANLEIWSMNADGSGKASYTAEPGMNLSRPEGR